MHRQRADKTEVGYRTGCVIGSQRTLGSGLIDHNQKMTVAAIAEARLAIEGWLETARANNMPIPEPRYRPAIYAAA